MQRFYPPYIPQRPRFVLNTEHLLQAGNSHLKYLYFVLMKQERHISIMPCTASNDFRQVLLLLIVRPFPTLLSPEAALFWSVVPKGARPLGARMYFRSRNYVCTAHAHQGGNSVWQMGEYVFFWRLPSPSHLNQLFCNLHDLWIEFSACLERRLLKRRTTVAVSGLPSRT